MNKRIKKKKMKNELNQKAVEVTKVEIIKTGSHFYELGAVVNLLSEEDMFYYCEDEITKLRQWVLKDHAKVIK